MLNLMLVATFSACALGQDAPAELLRALKIQQQENQVVLGTNRGGEFTFIDTSISNKGFRLTSQHATLRDGPILVLKDGAESQTEDGKWSASCKRHGTCTIVNKQDSSKKIVLKFKGIASPILWSPDERFIFYVIKAPAFRFPMSFDDERDVIVQEISTGLHGRLTTVASLIASFLHWYQFDKPLPSSPELTKRH